jgi:hypothetical protein
MVRRIRAQLCEAGGGKEMIAAIYARQSTEQDVVTPKED